MNLLDDVATCIPGGSTYSTPFTTLVFEECNIRSEGLCAILSLPEALDTLYLGENAISCHNFEAQRPPHSNELFEREPGRAMHALEQQKHALRVLTYVAVTTRLRGLAHRPCGPFPTDGAFAKFPKLEDVTLIGRSPPFERCLMNEQSGLNLVRTTLKDLDYELVAGIYDERRSIRYDDDVVHERHARRHRLRSRRCRQRLW